MGDALEPCSSTCLGEISFQSSSLYLVGTAGGDMTGAHEEVITIRLMFVLRSCQRNSFSRIYC